MLINRLKQKALTHIHACIITNFIGNPTVLILQLKHHFLMLTFIVGMHLSIFTYIFDHPSYVAMQTMPRWYLVQLWVLSRYVGWWYACSITEQCLNYTN